MSRVARRRRRWSAVFAVLLALSPTAESDEAGAPSFAPPVLCRLQTVSVGQFHGLDYGPGVPSGSSTLIVAASPDDLRDHRATIVGREGTFVARVVPTRSQTLLVAVDPDGGSLILSIFPGAGPGGVLPATLSRQRTIGTTPLVVQGAGSCRHDPG